MKTNSLGIKLLHISEGLASTTPNTDARNTKNLPTIASLFQLKNDNLILYPYFDSVGVLTIGYGHTLTFKTNKNAFKLGITKRDCDELFETDLRSFESSVSRLITSPINENQFSALVSFCYNLGAGSLQVSTLRRKINSNPNDFEAIGAQFKKWNMAGGRVLNALTIRREEEFKLYKTPVTNSNIISDKEIQKNVDYTKTDNKFFKMLLSCLKYLGKFL